MAGDPIKGFFKSSSYQLELLWGFSSLFHDSADQRRRSANNDSVPYRYT